MVRWILIIVLLALVLVLGWALLSPVSVPLPYAGTRSGPGGQNADADVSLTVSERRLAREMATSLQNNPNLRDPRFELAPPDRARVTVSAYTQIFGQTLQIRPTVAMRFVLVDGRVEVRPDGMEVIGLTLPDWLADLPMREFTEPIERQVNDTVRQVTDGSGLQLISVSTTDDSLVLGFS
jgi:hypothetical protein